MPNRHRCAIAAFAALLLCAPAFAGDLEDGNALRTKGKWDEALAKFEKAAAADPKDAAAALAVSETLVALGRYEPAARCLADAIEANPANAALLIARARAYVFLTEQAYKTNPDDGSMIRAYANDAGKWARRALEADATSSDAKVLLAKATVYDTGDSAAAVKIYEEVAAADPKCFDAHWELGQLATQAARADNRNKSKWAKAEQHYRNAFAADPKSGLALLNATWCKQWQGLAQVPEYIADYAACAKLMPGDTRPLSGIWKLSKAPNTAAAVAAFEALGKDHPKAKAYALVGKGRTALAAGKPANVDDHFADAIQACGDGETSELYLVMMDEAYRSADLLTAQREKIWSALYKWSPKNFQAPNTAGLWYRDTGHDYEKSAAWYVRAAEAAPQSPQVQQDTGLIYHYHLNKPDTAEKYYRKAIRLANDQGIAASNDGSDPEGVGFRDAMVNLSKVLVAQKRWKDLGEFAENDVPSDFPMRKGWLEDAKKGN